ncbi:hypothetical protein LJR225_000334 [Phenylobacterium sp. LjRoot225]|uniref:hypothetical protein n=1 Tax=Phenylobacterium sp. LjRoot225 TaxID=3342285 RepID=UPI003ECC7CCB
MRVLIGRQLEVLGRLAEAGLNIALAVERQVMAVEQASPEAGSPEAGSGEAVQRMQALALAYGRVSRAVRLTIALQSQLVKDLQDLDATAARRAAGQQADAGRERRILQSARKEQVERIVERLIRTEAGDGAEADRLAEEAWERLDHDDIYGDLLARPVREIIALVCQDLGLAPDWSRWAQEAWAQGEIGAGAAGAAAEPPITALRWLDPPEFAPTAAPADPARCGGGGEIGRTGPGP